jgi:hypothetical protein
MIQPGKASPLNELFSIRSELVAPNSVARFPPMAHDTGPTGVLNPVASTVTVHGEPDGPPVMFVMPANLRCPAVVSLKYKQAEPSVATPLKSTVSVIPTVVAAEVVAAVPVFAVLGPAPDVLVSEPVAESMRITGKAIVITSTRACL